MARTLDYGIELSAFREAPEVRRHIDGPVLQWAGRMHWLTLPERLYVFLGWDTPYTLARKHFGRP